MATEDQVHQTGKCAVPQAKSPQTADATWSSPYQHLQGGIVTAMDVWRTAQHGDRLQEATPSRTDPLPRVTKRQASPMDRKEKRPKLCAPILPGTPSGLPRFLPSKPQQLQDEQPVPSETLLDLLSTLLPPQIVICDRVNPRDQQTQFATLIAQQKQWALVYFSYTHNVALMLTPTPIASPSFESLHMAALEWAAQFPIAVHTKRKSEFHVFESLPFQGNEPDDGIIALVLLLHVAVSDIDVTSSLQIPSINAKLWQYLLHRSVKRDDSESSPQNYPSLEEMLQNTLHAEDLATKLAAAAVHYHQETTSFKSQTSDFESICRAAEAASCQGPLLATIQDLLHQALKHREQQVADGLMRANNLYTIMLHLKEALDDLKEKINSQLKRGITIAEFRLDLG